MDFKMHVSLGTDEKQNHGFVEKGLHWINYKVNS